MSNKAEKIEWAQKQGRFEPNILKEVLGYIWYVLVGRSHHIFSWKSFFFAVRIIFALLLPALPILARYYLDEATLGPSLERLLDEHMWSLVCILSVPVAYNFIHDIIDRRKRYGRRRYRFSSRLAGREEQIYDAIEQYVDFSGLRSASSEDSLKEITRRILRAVQNKSQMVLVNYESGTICVNFLRFRHPQKMEVFCRSDDSRQEGVQRNREDFMAFFVAKYSSGSDRYVSRFNNKLPFGNNGISTTERNYKSVMYMPIVDKKGSKLYCYGVVSVDSKRPFEFVGWRAERLVKLTASYRKLLTMVMSTQNKVEVKNGDC